MKKRLFDAYGPVSTFAAKIDLAFALGITTEAIHQELNKMRRIRNAFAHTKDGVSLDTEPVKAMFYTLARPADIAGSYLEQFTKCGVLIDDHLEAYLVSKGETEDLRLLKTPPAIATKDEKPTEPVSKPTG
jgi:DNA-binding MltR family transcriptional regulator